MNPLISWVIKHRYREEALLKLQNRILIDDAILILIFYYPQPCKIYETVPVAVYVLVVGIPIGFQAMVSLISEEI